jgi:conjugal transfer pilus assembly protein TraU
MNTSKLLTAARSALLMLLLAGSPFAQAQETPAPGVSGETEGEESSETCRGNWFNPLSDPDYNNIFPFTILGVELYSAGNSNPPTMYTDATCYCPTRWFGIYFWGFMVTYWQPIYLVEIGQYAGCGSSIGGEKILDNYDRLNSEQSFHQDTKEGAAVTRMQIHWYEYPIFSIMDYANDFACSNADTQVDLAYMTEIDSGWQSDMWAGVIAPEANLFTSIVAQAACAVDSVAALFSHPIDALFWCAGTWGGIYPLAGNANQSLGTFQVNHLVLAKYLAREARFLKAWMSIGKAAECSPVPNPIWVKTQYRFNQVYPYKRKGKPLVAGASWLRQKPPITNAPTKETTNVLIFQAVQCCVTF